MVKIGLIEVDENQYPDLDLKEYMKCQSTAFSTSIFSFIPAGGAGFIATQLLPKIYPKYHKKYNIIVIAGVAIVSSYLVSQTLTKQCQRKFLMSAAPGTKGQSEKHFSQKRIDAETINEGRPTGVLGKT